MAIRSASGTAKRKKKLSWRSKANITKPVIKSLDGVSRCRSSTAKNSSRDKKHGGSRFMALTFGISFAPNHPKEVADWCRAAEDCGFERVGLVDSQSIYREVYVCCTAGLQATKSIKIGPRVTNALTRHPSVTASGLATMAELAPGRVFAGVGTGDSALINIGMRPIKLGPLGQFVTCLRALMRGEKVLYQGSELGLSWSGADIPIYVSAHGPKTVEFSGQYAEGVIYGDGVGQAIVNDGLACVAVGAGRAGR